MRSTTASTFCACVSVLALVQGCGLQKNEDAAVESLPRQSFVETAPGVRVEVVEWGGTGPALLLLAGATHSAWVYEDLAPHFTDQRTVFGMTRRRHGHSDAPAEDFGMPDLVSDIVAVLDAFSIEKADIIGHSFGGAELTYLALAHPERIRKAVYLDGGWDFYEMYNADGWWEGWPEFPPGPADSASAEALAAQIARTLGALFPMRELRAIHEFDSNGRLVALNPEVGDMFQGLIRPTLSPVDPGQISVPVLSVQAIPERVQDFFGGYDQFDEETKRMAEAVFAKWQRVVVEGSRRFVQGVPGAQGLRLFGAHHELPVTEPERFVPVVRDFLFR